MGDEENNFIQKVINHKIFSKKELWFFNTKKNFADFWGLSIYEADSIVDLEYYYKQFESIELVEVMTKDLDILSYLKQNFDYKCSYNEKTQKIFRLFQLINKTDMTFNFYYCVKFSKL